jgi:hypothetical protein
MVRINLLEWYFKLRTDHEYIGISRVDFCKTYSFLCFTVYIKQERQ